jgi:hypothetical protein
VLTYFHTPVSKICRRLLAMLRDLPTALVKANTERRASEQRLQRVAQHQLDGASAARRGALSVGASETGAVGSEDGNVAQLIVLLPRLGHHWILRVAPGTLRLHKIEPQLYQTLTT